MRWVIVAAIALLLVIACVVYIQYERKLVPPPAPIASVPIKPRPKIRPVARKPGPPSPVDITGPLKDRALIHWVIPDYPEWAQERGITGVFSIKIWVSPAGEVKSFMEPQKLSGEQRLDDEAVSALRQWQFVEKPNSFGDQWGVVTIRFSLLPQGETTDASVQGVSLGTSTVSGAWECVQKWVGDVKKQLVYICKLKPRHAAE